MGHKYHDNIRQKSRAATLEQRIYSLLADGKSWDYREVADTLGMKPATLSRVMSQLHRTGALTKVATGRYKASRPHQLAERYAAPASTTTTTTSEENDEMKASANVTHAQYKQSDFLEELVNETNDTSEVDSVPEETSTKKGRTVGLTDNIREVMRDGKTYTVASATAALLDLYEARLVGIALSQLCRRGELARVGVGTYKMVTSVTPAVLAVPEAPEVPVAVEPEEEMQDMRGGFTTPTKDGKTVELVEVPKVQPATVTFQVLTRQEDGLVLLDENGSLWIAKPAKVVAE